MSKGTRSTRWGSLRILTRKMYYDAIVRYQARQATRLLERWDAGAKKYGDCDLDARDWEQELQEEMDDAVAYTIIKGEAER